MAELGYIRDYFTENTQAWIDNAYTENGIAPKYPLGNERVAAAWQAVLDRLGQPRGRLLDLGCGGGQLCFEAAAAGMHAVGIDIADGMIEHCHQQTRSLPTEQQNRLEFHVGSVVDTGLPNASFDAIAALGLIEYVPEDEPFLSECWRLLQPGGALIVTCRNRLFNLFSQNDYTAREIDDGMAAELLGELRTRRMEELTPADLHAFLRSFKAALPMLEAAVHRDELLPQSRGGGRAFAQELRQHTPGEIAASAERTGFVDPTFVCVHPHPFAPQLEQVAPHFYNALAQTLSCLSQRQPAFTWSSCFQATFTKPT